VIAEAPYSSCAFFFWAATVGMLSLGFHAGGSSYRNSRTSSLYRDQWSAPIFWARFYLSGCAVCSISLFSARPDVHCGGPLRPGGSERSKTLRLLDAVLPARMSCQRPYP
jgi:hypothetical protein